MTKNVFEAVNWTRREHLVALSPLDADAFWAALQAARPPEVAHWDLAADKIAFECVGQDMPEADAAAFLESYLKSLQMPGWTVLSLPDGAR